MAKVHQDQFNLFGGAGAVTEIQVAKATDAGVKDAYLKCSLCKGCSQQLQIPAYLDVNSDEAMRHARKQAGWTHECPDCEKAGRCPQCREKAA